MPQHRPAGSACRRHALRLHLSAPRKQIRPRENRSQTACWFSARRDRSSLYLRRGGVGGALVVDPAYPEVVTLLAALEGEFYVRVLGDRATPVCHEYGFAVVFEGQLLDEVRRD